jgi:hypothetical protein
MQVLVIDNRTMWRYWQSRCGAAYFNFLTTLLLLLLHCQPAEPLCCCCLPCTTMQ